MADPFAYGGFDVIALDRVSVTYDGATEPTLRDVTLSIDEGELVLLVGRTGAGKSTLLGTLNGLVPHFTGGRLDGTVTVAGTSTRERPPRELAHLVGYVGQDPLAGFVTDTVEDELAYGMEQLGVEPQTMRRRVEETLDLLGIADLRRRALRTLSGGQQQRVAIGSVLTMHPPVLVLDEPTSALDPTAAEEVLATLARLVHDLGTTVVLAEHRMERVVPFADRMLWIGTDGRVTVGRPAEVLRGTPIGPPVVELGRLAGWDPLPLTVRDARRRAAPLRDKLDGVETGRRPGRPHDRALSRPDVMTSRAGAGGEVLAADGVTVRYGSTVAVRGVGLALAAGDVLAVMGRNGSGKSSLLWATQGAGPRHGGTVRVGGRVGMVPQTASDLLYLETVQDECATGDREASAAPGTCRALLERMAPGVDDRQHPRDLSEGQKLALVLAVQLAVAPRVLLLDEPTRGLDYTAKAALAGVVTALSGEGRAVVVATHDVEFVATVANRAMVMADGEVISEGDAVDVVAGSPAFAPQVTKILGSPWLTVDEVREALL